MQPLKIVSFGTSLSANGGWQPALKAKLSACLRRPVEIDIVALAGSTSHWALTQLDRVADARPNIVLIEFYANDAALDRWTSVGTSKANIAAVVDGLGQKLPEARLVVMAMNPIFGLRGLMRPFLSRYIAAHREVAADKGIEFIDHGPGWARLTDAQRSQSIPDGLHPTADMAADIMAPELTRLLSQGQCTEPATHP